MKRKKELFFLFIFLLLMIGGYFLIQKKNQKEQGKKNTIEHVNAIDIDVTLDNSDTSIDWSVYKEKEIELTPSITITEGGVYILSGTLENGSVTVNTNEYVKLILNNVHIKNENGPAIYIENAKTTVIWLEEGAENSVEDGSTYSTYEEEVNSTIYSKDDLVFDGLGKLYITANYEDGIVGKDDLKIINGTYIIQAKDDGIRGKDSLYIQEGNFQITAGGDGLKSTNTTDTKKGFIYIENGNFTIDATCDGMDAESKILIQSGRFEIKTGGGSENASHTSKNWGNWGRREVQTIDTASAKGIKAKTNLVIQGGTFTLDTSDDGIHSNNTIGIVEGTFTIFSGDDGIHADTELIIEGGNISINKSYEGIEAAKITIQNGTISIVSTDDGINVAGGNDASSIGRPGENHYTEDTDNVLKIYNGTIYVNATGDGIDVNGNGYIYGGDITVDGPSDNGNGALDYDGEFVVDEGTISLIGSSGMLQGISSSSKQYNVTMNFGQNYSENSQIEVLDEDGEIILSKTSSKSFSSFVFSSNKLKKDGSYTVKVNGEVKEEFTIKEITTNLGTMGGMQPEGKGERKDKNPENGERPMGPNGKTEKRR